MGLYLEQIVRSRKWYADKYLATVSLGKRQLWFVDFANIDILKPAGGLISLNDELRRDVHSWLLEAGVDSH